MYSIKNVKYDVYQFAPITVSCNNYSKLLDVVLKLTVKGLKLDISYLEDLKWLKDNDRYNREAIEDGYTQEKIEILIKAFGEIFENRLAAFKWDW